MKTIRSFLAIRLDIETVRVLADVQKDLKVRCNEANIRVRWVPPPNMHVTIRFLGQVTEPMAFAVKDMLEPITSGTDAFELETAGLGIFPDAPKPPRVVWAGLRDGTDALTKLFNALSGRLVEAGFHFDEKPFRSHVTIGRVKDGSTDELAGCLGDQELAFGTTWVRNLYCYRSDLKPSGAEYHGIWRLPFARGARRIERGREPIRPQPNLDDSKPEDADRPVEAPPSEEPEAAASPAGLKGEETP